MLPRSANITSALERGTAKSRHCTYRLWLVFEDYPKFVTAIKRVRKLDANHFVASLGFNGKQYETTLEMMLCVPERRLAWRTLADHRAPDHFAAGVVSLASLSDQTTGVTQIFT